MLDNNIIYLSNVRLSFPFLTQPRKPNPEFGNGKSVYCCDLLMPQDHPGLIQFMRRYKELAVDSWKENTNRIMEMIQSDRKSRCYGAGEEKLNKKTFHPYDGYTGMIYLSCIKDTPPQIIQADGTEIDPNNSMVYQQLTGSMYAGCRVNAAVKPWLQNNQFGKAIRCELAAIQFAGNDEAFGEGGLDVSQLFSPVSITPETLTSETTNSMPSAPFSEPMSPGLPSFLNM